MAGSAPVSIADREALSGLIPALEKRGYQVIGPVVRDGAIVYDTLTRLEDLPAGVTDAQSPGRYRLAARTDGALFGFHCGPQSWKNFLHPADIRLFSTDKRAPYAFLGVRACELAAIRIQDRILVEDRYPDALYQSRRRGAMIIAVNCTEASEVCFCQSVGCGPVAQSGFDLALTELTEDGRHEFAIEAGSQAGEEVLAELDVRSSGDDGVERIRSATASAAPQTRNVDTAGLRELLADNFEHPRWDEVAQRCLSCGNCTMVCPTCFCTTVEDVSDIDGTNAARLRKWDSCFTQAFSYIHGGSVRASVKSRYRQWLTHKLSTWVDQFGSLGCVGCGRCIAWCPAGIDITAEVRAIRESGFLRSSTTEAHHGIA